MGAALAVVLLAMFVFWLCRAWYRAFAPSEVAKSKARYQNRWRWFKGLSSYSDDDDS